MFVAPSVILTMALGIYPILWALRYMFFDYRGYGEPQYIGFDNFTRLWHDHDLWMSIWNTIIYAAGKLVLTIPIALVLSGYRFYADDFQYSCYGCGVLHYF
jgi:raffinose/stachyose/melibiose transport system permease protein